MTKEAGLSGAGRGGFILLLAVVVILFSPGALSSDVSLGSSLNASSNGTYSNNLVLNVYLNDAGKALVTGYADSIDGLSFLRTSQYRYDQDTRQLYVLTNALTSKSGDNWEAKLLSEGSFGEYHSTFYLPSSVSVSNINSSRGLEYLVSASNDSFVVDLHGYDVVNPGVTIDYQVPIGVSASPPTRPGSEYVLHGLALGLIIAAGAAVAWTRRGRKTAPSNPGAGLEGSSRAPLTAASASLGEMEDPAASAAGPSPSADPDLTLAPDPMPAAEPNLTAKAEDDQSAAVYVEAGAQELGEPGPSSAPSYEEPEEEELSLDELEDDLLKPTVKSIEITSEMAAVMETLTGRERAVLTALIDHNGKMTQANIRYETRIPKSSLTGILLSLERRKLVIKKEWGRTNIIELSDWFLSKKERS